jgi:hypothetical protein
VPTLRGTAIVDVAPGSANGTVVRVRDASARTWSR